MNETQYNLNDLFRGTVPESFNPVQFGVTPANQNTFSGGVGTAIDAGEFLGNTTMQDGYFQSSNFATGSTGWKLSPTGIEAQNGTFSGTITATAGAIGGFNIGADYIRDAANSFGMASTVTGGDDVRFWAGDTFANRATAVFRVTEAGAATFKSATIGNWTVNTTSIYTGTEDHSGYTANAGDITIYSDGSDSSIHANQFYIDTSGIFHSTAGSISGTSITAIPNDTSTDISLLEATHDLVFSVTDKDTVAWALGTITMSNGRTFSITASNTGNMVARTYIYLDTGVSSTALQTTTTTSTAMGANKKLIAVAQNGSAQAQFTVYGGIGGIKLPASSTSVSNNNWTYSGAWSVTDADTVAWGAGTLTTSDGGSYSIDTSNTGNMAAKTYIYFDLGTSSTAFQTTTTAATAIGDGKILIAIAQNGTNEANYLVVNDKQSNIDAAQIVAGSITANEIAASTITAAKLSVSQLSAITADLGTITAGSITINSGVASINSSGDATFKSIQIGDSTRQYSISGSGIFSFGDGSDGDATITSDTTLASDKYYDDLTVNNNATLNPGGYRIFVAGVLTLSGNGKIARNGTNGNNGSNSGASPAGGASVSLADGYLKGSPATGAGGNGGTSGGGFGAAGSAGTNTSNSLGSSGVNGGAGGNNSVPEGGGAAGTGGTATTSNVKLIANWHLATLLDVSSTGSTVKYDNSASAAGGGGGAGSAVPSAGTGGGGGSGGTSGGIVAIYAKSIVINSGSSITTTGGNGGSGGAGQASSNAGGGGGGGGGNGGIIVLVYNSLSNSGSITAAAGTGGTGGGKGSAGGGSDGAAGSNGSPGVIYQFQISL